MPRLLWRSVVRRRMQLLVHIWHCTISIKLLVWTLRDRNQLLLQGKFPSQVHTTAPRHSSHRALEKMHSVQSWNFSSHVPISFRWKSYGCRWWWFVVVVAAVVANLGCVVFVVVAATCCRSIQNQNFIAHTHPGVFGSFASHTPIPIRRASSAVHTVSPSENRHPWLYCFKIMKLPKNYKTLPESLQY